jgi:hypothetical protein
VANDVLGGIEVYGRVGGASVQGAGIAFRVSSVAGGIAAGLGISASNAGAYSEVIQIQRQAAAAGLQLNAVGTNPLIVPVTNGAGALGVTGSRWGSAHINTIAVGVAVPTALVHLAAGTAAAGTAPLKITAGGIVLAAPESGAIESTDTHIYWTNNAGTRLQLDNDAVVVPNLAAVYDAGASTANQTMTVTTAKGGGVIIDCSGAGVTTTGVSLLVRQNTTWELPMTISRRGGDNGRQPQLVFEFARGTYAAPTNMEVGDGLGSIEFYGRHSGAFVLGNYILSERLTSVAAGLATVLRFYGADNSVSQQMMSLQTGNVCLGDATPGANAHHTLVLPETNAVPPDSSVGLVHLYGALSQGTDQCAPVAGTALAISQECGTIAVLNATGTFAVPVTVNGVGLLLLAIAQPAPA